MSRIRNDKFVAILFLVLTLLFTIFAITNRSFSNWIFERHLNQWSWYIRPIFLIPFCYFAYRRSWTGISMTVFLLITSMCWFNKPTEVNENVKVFLLFEQNWLSSEWTFQKVLLILTVPVSFFALGAAFWKRSLIMGLGVVVLMATGKIVWSILSAGDAGKSILVPAITGLLICCLLILYGFRKLEKRKL